MKKNVLRLRKNHRSQTESMENICKKNHAEYDCNEQLFLVKMYMLELAEHRKSASLFWSFLDRRWQVFGACVEKPADVSINFSPSEDQQFKQNMESRKGGFSVIHKNFEDWFGHEVKTLRMNVAHLLFASFNW